MKRIGKVFGIAAYIFLHEWLIWLGMNYGIAARHGEPYEAIWGTIFVSLPAIPLAAFFEILICWWTFAFFRWLFTGKYLDIWDTMSEIKWRRIPTTLKLTEDKPEDPDFTEAMKEVNQMLLPRNTR